MRIIVINTFNLIVCMCIMCINSYCSSNYKNGVRLQGESGHGPSRMHLQAPDRDCRVWTETPA